MVLRNSGRVGSRHLLKRHLSSQRLTWVPLLFLLHRCAASILYEYLLLHAFIPPSFIYSPLVHSFNRIFSMRTCVTALPEHLSSVRTIFWSYYSLDVLFSGLTIFWSYYLLGKSIVYMYLCSAPPLHVPTLYPWPFGLIIFLICTSFVPNLLGLLLNPASPSLNILSIGIFAPLHLSQAYWLSFIRHGFILLSALEEMPLLSCKATSGVGLNCGLAICCLVCAPTGYSTSNS